MVTYKITNITNLAGKRDIKYNSTLDIDYVDSMMKKTIKVMPGETVYLQISSLPLSVHRLRVKRLISVVEITDTELKRTMNAAKPKEVKPTIEEESRKKVSNPTIKKKELKPEVKKMDSGKKSNEPELLDIE